MDKDQKKSKSYYLKSVAYFVVLSAILIAAVIGGYFVLTVVTGESNPFTVVTGTSMVPTIMPGTVAIISHVPFADLQIGNIIVFQPQVAQQEQCDSSTGGSLTSETANPCFVIHRIVTINNDSRGTEYLTTEGDANDGPIPGYDTGITASMYVGKVVLLVPYLGYLTEPPYNEYAAALILLALIGQFVWEKRTPENKQQKSQK